MLKQSVSRIKKVLPVLLAAFVVLFLTAVAANAESKSGGKIVEVAIQNFVFSPMSVKISANDTVKWTNMDSFDHIVDGSIFKSGMISKGQSYEFLFTEPGVYNYTCSLHPYLKGTVIVVEKK